ncbi:MAG: hypothetical protein KatS3mg111_0779 [Pirellulaceae bacterium]|nr:MAG: hypothetical protein KatS3mg111_0779 [Pirellulaceae bacterium]
MKRTILVGCTLVGAALVGLASYSRSLGDDPSPADGPAAEARVVQARKTVKMLDDIYKTAVVLITDKYVEDEDSFAAGAAAVALFDAIEQKGWHKAQLLDVTGDPYDSDNVADDAFEREAIKAIKAGKSFVEKVEKGPQGETIYRAMTAIPVVHSKCVMCHPHYADVQAGAAVGAISYALPLDK